VNSTFVPTKKVAMKGGSQHAESGQRQRSLRQMVPCFNF
jgi:hypothetical protein